MALDPRRSPQDFESLLHRFFAFIGRIRDLILGWDLTSTWVRVLLILVTLPLIYSGLRWLVGESPTLAKQVGDDWRAGMETVKDIIAIIRAPEGPPKPPSTKISAPQGPAWWRFFLLVRRFRPDTVQSLLAFVALPFFWSVLKAVNVFEDAFHTGRVRSAASYITLIDLPLIRPRYALREGSLIQQGLLTRLRLIGGPARLQVLPDTLGVLENAAGQARVVSASGSPHMVSAFEKLYRVLPLWETSLTISHNLRTRDGFPLALKDAGFVYFIARSPQDGPPNSYDPQAVLALVYRHWVGKNWENPPHRDADVTLLVKQELARYVGGLDTLDLLPYLAPGEVREQFPIERQVLQEFVHAFNQKSSQHGLQIRWQGNGQWDFGEVLAAADHPEAFQASLQDRHLRERLARLAPRAFSDDQIQRQAERILQHYAELQQRGADRTEIVRQLIMLYEQYISIQ